MPNRRPYRKLIRVRRHARRTGDIGIVQHGIGLIAGHFLVGRLEIKVRALRQVVVRHQSERVIFRILVARGRIHRRGRIDVLHADEESRRELILAVDFEVLELERGHRAAVGWCDRSDIDGGVRRGRLANVRVRIGKAERRRAERVADAAAENAQPLRDEIRVVGRDGSVRRQAGTVRLEIGPGHQQTAVRVLAAQTVLAVVGEVSVVAETVGAAELQTRKIRTGVLDRVVHAKRVVGIVVVVRMREQSRPPSRTAAPA